jgi:hypothetical protein
LEAAALLLPIVLCQDAVSSCILARHCRGPVLANDRGEEYLGCIFLAQDGNAANLCRPGKRSVGFGRVGFERDIERLGRIGESDA